jgi:type IV pilus assembly protein PilW
MTKIKHIKMSQGFSLVELMISLALGSIVSAGVVQLFVANSETQALLVGQSRMQESARFSLAFIGREVRQAGYRGCYPGGENLITTLDLDNPLNPGVKIPYEFDMRVGLRGYNATGDSLWTPALTEIPNTATDLAMDHVDNTVFKTTYTYGNGTGIDLSTIVSGTDVVTFRRISQIDARLGGFSVGGTETLFNALNPVMPTRAEDLVVGIRNGWSEFDLDHIAMIHDCEKATMFRVTTSNPWGRNADGSPKAKTGDGNLVIGHDIANADLTRNSIAVLSRVGDLDSDASVSAILTSVFYIAPGAGTNNDGNQPLSLWKKEGLNRPIELVEGVENLQILYGEDNSNDGVPNQYHAANFVADFANVVTIRVTVVVNSIDNVGSSSDTTLGCAIQDCIDGEDYDGLLRRAFSQTIMLRNQI